MCMHVFFINLRVNHFNRTLHSRGLFLRVRSGGVEACNAEWLQARNALGKTLSLVYAKTVRVNHPLLVSVSATHVF